MIYINKFYLPTKEEYNVLNEFYPFNVFSNKKFKEISFENITTFYGSNG